MIPQGFTERMKRLLGEEYPLFAAAYERPVSPGLRLNTLKTDDFPDLSAFSLLPVPWAENGYYYDPGTRPGLSPYHEAGLYYMQEPSAMAPAELLDVQPGMRVLDLCAAPGGKTTQLAAKLLGKGLLVCNEIHPPRAKILSRNAERCAVANALVLNEHPAKLEKRFENFFHRVLVDAPCSGEGMFRKEEAAGEDWSEDLVEMCARRQSEILASAAKMLAEGGKLVYSTCTFSPQENEGVIAKFLAAHPDFSVVKTENSFLDCGRPNWTQPPFEDAKYTFRLWPHKLRGEGHFAAVLQKNGYDKTSDLPLCPSVKAPREWEDFSHELELTLPNGRLVNFGQNLCLVPEEMPRADGLKVLRMGLELGQCLKNRFQPAHALALWLKDAKNTLELSPEGEEAKKYLRGETVATDTDGWILVTTGGFSLGWGKGSCGILKNHFPKGLRHL